MGSVAGACGASLLLLCCVASAEGIHPLAVEAMEAELRGDWSRAVELFRQAAQADPKDPWARPRLLKATARAMAFFGPELDALIRAKGTEELAKAATLAAIIEPNHSAVQRARRALGATYASLPPLPPESEGVVAAFPRRGPWGRWRCYGTQGAVFARAEAMVERGLDWLVSVQEANGEWNCESHGGKPHFDAAVTALALRALLSRGPTGLTGARGAAAERAAAFLRATQDSKGCFGPRESQHYHYNHVLVLQSLAEYASTTDAAEWKGVLAGGVAYLRAAQNRGAGWRYQPHGGESDTSVTARAVAALCAAGNAGVDVPDDAFQGALDFIREMTDSGTGITGYNMCGGGSARTEEFRDAFPAQFTQSMTAAGCHVRALLGQDVAEVLRQTALIAAMPPMQRYPDFYYWELGASACAAAFGFVPRAWYAQLVEISEMLLEAPGNIAARDCWSSYGGRVYATAMVALALTAPYREAPRPAQGASQTALLVRGGAILLVLAGDQRDLWTGLYADPGMELVARVSGAIAAFDGCGPVGPDGLPAVKGGPAPRVKGSPFACLMGRVGSDGKLFRIRAGVPFRVPEPGPLELFVNDAKPEDNTGAWRITIKLEK